MPAKLLFFGDIIGKPGRKALLKALPGIREKYNPDFVIVNVENMAHGKGVTVKTMQEIESAGADAYTSGNHVFDKEQLSFVRIEKNGQGFLVINLNAQVFFEKQFPGKIGSPFMEFDRIVAEQARPGDVVFVDFHSEATSEKRAFGFYTDGRASLVCGTHTHVPTADLQIQSACKDYGIAEIFLNRNSRRTKIVTN